MSKALSTESFKHVRTNPVTGEFDYYYPLEITDDSIRQDLEDLGLEICRTRLGNRVITAAMIPCKDIGLDVHGREVYLDTPSEDQRERYLEYIKDELAEQDAEKQDVRCVIPNGHGGLKRCPCRTAKPDYRPGNGQPKTIPVLCEGCVYEDYKRGNAPVSFTVLNHVDEGGEVDPYEPAAPGNLFDGDRYERMCDAFVGYVEEHEDKLTAQAALQTLEYSLTEVAEALDQPISTVFSRRKKLKALAEEFLDSTLIF